MDTPGDKVKIAQATIADTEKLMTKFFFQSVGLFIVMSWGYCGVFDLIEYLLPGHTWWMWPYRLTWLPIWLIPCSIMVLAYNLHDRTEKLKKELDVYKLKHGIGAEYEYN